MSNEALIRALKAYRDGDFSVRLDAASGVDPELVAVFNEITEKSKSFKSEIERVTHEVGVEGHLGQRFTLPNLSGDWQNMAENVSSMTANLDQQFRAISTVTHTVARGDLSHKISVRISFFHFSSASLLLLLLYIDVQQLLHISLSFSLFAS